VSFISAHPPEAPNLSLVRSAVTLRRPVVGSKPSIGSEEQMRGTEKRKPSAARSSAEGGLFRRSG